MKLPWVSRFAVLRTIKRLEGEIKQQKGYVAAEKKKAEALKAWSKDWQTHHQAIANFTGRVFGLEVALADLREIAS